MFSDLQFIFLYFLFTCWILLYFPIVPREVMQPSGQVDLQQLPNLKTLWTRLHLTDKEKVKGEQILFLEQILFKLPLLFHMQRIN